MSDTDIPVFGRALLILALVFTLRFLLTKWLRNGPTDAQKQAFQVAKGVLKGGDE